MKKKIINGILLVAMLFAATTSFVSCKDNVDDELIPLYAELAKVKSDIQTKIDAVEADIAALEQSDAEQDLAIAALEAELDALQAELDGVNAQISSLSGDVDEIRSDLAALGKRVDDLEETVAALIDQIPYVKDMILDLRVENTLNDVLGTINVPGFNLKSLAAFYGENLSGIEEFPFVGSDYNVGQGTFGAVLDSADIKGADKWKFYEEYYITSPHSNAGKVFFTVETSDPASFDISEYTLSVENSVAYTFPVEFTNVKRSAYLDQWGAFKSGNVDTDAEDAAADGTYYQADAHIAPENIEAAKFDLKKFINYKNLQTNFQNIVADIKAAKTNGASATAKKLVNETAKLVANIFSGNMSGNNQDVKNPTWSAQRLVLTKTNDDGTTVKRRAALDLAMTSVSPLSYNSFWKMEENAKAPSLYRVEKAVYKLANYIKAKLPKISIESPDFHIKKVEIKSSTEGYIVVSDTDDSATWTLDGVAVDDFLKDIADALNDGLQPEKLDEMIQSIGGKAIDLGPTVDNLANRFNSFLEASANKIVSLLNNHILTRAVEPIILFKSADGITNLKYGTRVKAGYMQINMTSPTEELIVPAYAKYIAVEKDGKVVESHTYAGRTQMVDLDLTKAGEYTIVLSCVDYYGYVITKKYLVIVE